VTPFGVARYPKISNPDTKGQYADNKFKTDLLIDEDEVAEVRIVLEEAALTFWPDQDDVAFPLKEFFADKEKTKSEGMGLVLKSQYRPAVFDAKKKALPEGVKIGGGSVIRVASSIYPWESTETQTIVDAKGKKTKETVTVYGIGLRLGDVQIRKLVAFTGSGDGSAFDVDEEGFEYEGSNDDGGFGDEGDAAAF